MIEDIKSELNIKISNKKLLYIIQNKIYCKYGIVIQHKISGSSFNEIASYMQISVYKVKQYYLHALRDIKAVSNGENVLTLDILKELK